MSDFALPETLTFEPLAAPPPPAVADDAVLSFPPESELPPPKRGGGGGPVSEFPVDPEFEDIVDVVPEDFGEAADDFPVDALPEDDFPVDALPDYDF